MLFSRLIEVVMCIPSLVLILALVAMLDSVTIYHLMAVIGITSWTSIARLARAEFLKLKQMEFVTAARAMGASRLADHVRGTSCATRWPRCSCRSRSASPQAILIESGLSYLGFGASPPNPSWGTLLNRAAWRSRKCGG